MKLLKQCALLALVLFCTGQAFTQSHKCATADKWQQSALKDPSMIERRQLSEIATQNWIANHSQQDETQAIITIPVVVHVVYNNQTENISLAQIQSQIAVLNEDFRLHNPDSVPLGHAFWPFTADSEIEFCLASVDPTGAPTNGVTRTSTSHGTFTDSNSDDVKFTNDGGHDNWDPSHYLNIWVCDLGGGLYGYATFPSELSTDPDYDGVVINYTAFGTLGTAEAPADLGRTGTHEIGHWLNLSHIWGDQTCGDDLVADTEPAEDSNFGCPGFPHNANGSCGQGASGEMFMNYMDYVDDNCMSMFTFGQKSRMRAALNGNRVALQSSLGCGGSAAIHDQLSAAMVSLSPNPSNGRFTLDAFNFVPRNASIVVTNAIGTEVQRHQGIKAFPYTLDLSALPSDIYCVRIASGNSIVSKKVVIAH